MSMEIASVVSAAANVSNVALVLVGLLIAWVQWRKARKVTQSEHLRSIIAAFKQNEIAQPFYRFINRDSSERADLEHFYLGDLQFVETRQTIDGDVESSDQIEIDIDRMLMLFSEICYKRELGVITGDEFRFFDYQIRMTLEHAEVKRYLFDFAEYCGKYQVGGHGHRWGTICILVPDAKDSRRAYKQALQLKKGARVRVLGRVYYGSFELKVMLQLSSQFDVGDWFEAPKIIAIRLEVMDDEDVEDGM